MSVILVASTVKIATLRITYRHLCRPTVTFDSCFMSHSKLPAMFNVQNVQVSVQIELTLTTLTDIKWLDEDMLNYSVIL
jgi:hypothetical protein